jgi:hypothetical protein
MKMRIASLAVGVALGVGLMLTVGAGMGAKTDREGGDRLKFVAYPNGVTGIFDPASGKLYMYASNMESCYAVYQVGMLGNPLVKTTP